MDLIVSAWAPFMADAKHPLTDKMMFLEDNGRFLRDEQYSRALNALAQRRGITPDETRKWIYDRMQEVPALASQDRPPGILSRLRRPVLGMAAMYGK